MGSGRGDRNQVVRSRVGRSPLTLQWGPVVVTGISAHAATAGFWWLLLQWGPVVVTGISWRSWVDEEG